jgi:hypothetical protein
VNGYDTHSTVFARPGRPTVAEASGDSRSDGKASQTKDGANRYDTSTPERRRKALAAARRSGNPEDEKRLKKQINSETNSTIEMLMLQQLGRRDNRARKRGGYRSPSLVVEVEGKAAEECDDGFADGYVLGKAAAGDGHGDWDREDPMAMDEAKGKLPPWLQKDGDGSSGDADKSKGKGSKRRGRVAESALNPQIKPRDTVDWNGFEEAELTTKKRNALPDKSFALPGDRYPIPDESHARNALARVAQNGTPEEISKVKAAVKKKFPGIDVSGAKEKKSS